MDKSVEEFISQDSVENNNSWNLTGCGQEKRKLKRAQPRPLHPRAVSYTHPDAADECVNV